ncbi:hypothetical protein Lal_00020303 [Lupinus albus]|nr:hypothetical protein Lal_00020303 [Lupinus albus]
MVMGENRLIVEEDFVIASEEMNPPPPSPKPLLMKINSIVSINSCKSYNRLPSQPLTLSILRLDASFFYVEVSKNASVGELKHAVEAIFSHMPQKISWPLVWGQFCLCYEGHRLVVETDYLRDYGIHDGDQLRFIRHVSNISSSRRKRSKKRVMNLKQHRRSTSPLSEYQQIEHSDEDDIDIENGKIQHCSEEEECIENNRLTTSLFGGFLPYSQVIDVRRARIESRNCPSFIARGVLESISNIRKVLCFGKRWHYSPKDAWRDY